MKPLEKPDYDLYRTDFKIIRRMCYTLGIIVIAAILYAIFA